MSALDWADELAECIIEHLVNRGTVPPTRELRSKGTRLFLAAMIRSRSELENERAGVEKMFHALATVERRATRKTNLGAKSALAAAFAETMADLMARLGK